MSVLEFYDQVEQKLTPLTNKTTMTYDSAIVLILNEKYRADSLRTFISGLKKPLCDIIFSSRPTNLPAALALAQEVESNHERYVFASSFANRSETLTKSNNMKDMSSSKHFSYDKEQFSNIQSSEKNQHFTKVQSQTIESRSNRNRFQSRQVEPMDVDPTSSRFRQPTNNKNFQSQEFYKRQAGSDRQTGPKIQRINHVAGNQEV